MPRSSRHGPFTSSIGNTLDVVVVSPNAFHSGSEIASSAAITSGNAAGSHPAIAALTAIELDRRDTVDRRQHAQRVVGRVRRGREQRLDRVVGGGQQRHAVAPTLRDRELVLRARIGADLDLLDGERHALAPSSASTCG